MLFGIFYEKIAANLAEKMEKLEHSIEQKFQGLQEQIASLKKDIKLV